MHYIPNILTLLRLIFIPLFLLLAFYDSVTARLIFFIGAIILGITDFLDGYLARKYHTTSNFGKVFDPIADKAFILVLCIMILIVNPDIVNIILLPIVLILVREFVISGIRENISAEAPSLNVTNLAKYKTAFQIIALCALILGGKENILLTLVQIFGVIFLYISMILTLLTGYSYIAKYFKYQNEGVQND